MTWRPIETAPRDGTVVQLGWSDDRAAVALWADSTHLPNGGEWIDQAGTQHKLPERWAPLDAPAAGTT